MELLAKVVGTAFLAILIELGVHLAGHWIAWWAAGLIAAVIVFGGFLILDDDMDWWHK